MPMTSRERVGAALEHREPDRTPIFEYVLLSPLADKLLGRLYTADPDNWIKAFDDLGWEKAVRQMAIDRVELASLLGHDLIYTWPNPLPAKPDNGERAPRADPPLDPVDRVRRRNEEGEAGPASIPDDSLLIYVFLKEEMRRRGLDLPILAPAYAHGIWTDVDLMQTLLIDPGVAHAHFALASRGALAHIEKYLALDLELIGVGGDFAGTRPLISPAMYREFIMPEVRVCARRIHGAGRWAVNASDGDLWSVIDDFLLGCEVDGYLEIDRFAGMGLRKLKKQYGARIAFFGDLDCGNMLSFATPEAIYRDVLDCLDAGSGNGGHILCASNAITSSVPLENYLAILRAYRERFNLPPFSR